MLSTKKLRVVDLIRRRARRSTPSDTAAESIAALGRQKGRLLRVAIARVDGIGDWLITLPLAIAVRDHPAVDEVTLISDAAHRGLLERDGFRFEGIDLWASHHTPWPHGAAGKVLAISRLGQRRAQRVGRAFRGRYDLVILPRWDTDRGQNLRFFAVGTGAEIAGHDPGLQPQASPKERAEGDVLTIACRDSREHAHESMRIEALSDALGVEGGGPGSVREFLGLRSHRSLPQQAVILHTSAHDAFRCWPIAHWSALISALLEGQNNRVVLVGSPADRDAHAQFVALDPERVRSVAGETGLNALPAVLDDAAVFVGNDSGPAHFAAGVGVPVVVVSCFPVGDDPSHPNSPDRFAPRSSGGTTILRPPPQPIPFAQMSAARRDALISQVSVADVLRATNDALERTSHV
ncbi:glycosyltransferase family 9 protein [Microbacterium sp.]|uniref:glycosyltransferase family 9 protein n=1 Tax=Microbacterium sp. TaxID=51671 RepID=UPI00333EF046